MVTLKEAERIRTALGLTVYAFSMKLGYSATAYLCAVKRGRMSKWMAKEVAVRYGRRLAEGRSA